ncbi:MAG: 50S ribosomal protein L29 [Nanoarchaeota archaeon]|nr:50S ribosomal protein L29 [Nanoarchaeota archaeon]
MPAKKMKELKSLSEKDLRKKLSDLRKEMIKLNAQVATGTTPKSPGLIRGTKRTIAMILTLLRQKEIESIKGEEVTKTNE